MKGRPRKAWQATRNALGYGPAGRLVTVRDDDTFLVSYPRSGNTWLRFIVSNLVDPTSAATFLNVEISAADIYRNSDRSMVRRSSPRLLKSHEYYDPRYGRVLYVVRDPRDVVSSYYRWHVRNGSISDRFLGTDFLQLFLKGELDAYGSWLGHVGSWLGAREKDEEFLLIRYEDILSDPINSGRQLCSFLGIARSDQEIKSAMNSSNRATMQSLETLQKNSSPILRGDRRDIPFVGSGTEVALNESDEYLRSDYARREIESRFGRMMGELNYL